MNFWMWVAILIFWGLATGWRSIVAFAKWRKSPESRETVLLGVRCAESVVMSLMTFVMGFTLAIRLHPAALLPAKLTFNVVGDNVGSAELWVNGVCLGNTPLAMTEREFLAKVPRWDKPPDGFEKKEYVLDTSHGSQWGVVGFEQRPCWVEIDGYSVPEALRQSKWYYQAKYAGEWGVDDGASSGGQTIAPGFIFLNRGERLKSLLNLARLTDYHVDEKWIAAIETYNEDGWVALRKAVAIEPGMIHVLDDWANWKYHLQFVQTPKDAWNVLQQICLEAEQRGEYISASVAGRAVEILAQRLDPEQVAVSACRLLLYYDGYAVSRWSLAGKMHFSFTGWNGLHIKIDDQSQGGAVFASGRNDLPPRGYVIAHAVWELWQLNRGRDLIQDQIAPALVAQHYDGLGGQLPLEIAAQIGGPKVDEFFLKQISPPDPRGSDWQNKISIGYSNDQVDKWNYLRGILNDGAGEEFRNRNIDVLTAMDEQLIRGNHSFELDRETDFITADRPSAIAFFPRFVQITRDQSPNDAIGFQWKYLNRIDAPVSEYVDAWNQAKPMSEQAFWSAIRALHAGLDTSKRIEIVRQIISQMQQDPHAIKPDRADSDPNRNDLMWLQNNEKLPEIDLYLKTLADNIAHLSDNPPRWPNRMETELWLEQPEAGNSSVVKTLADSADARLRALALCSVRGVSNSANRQILQQLLNDPDPTVRTEAEKVDAELKSFSQRNPMDFSSTGQATAPNQN